MAKQKASTIGVIVVVCFIVFILALGGGFFKNFAIQNNGLDVSIPTVMTVDGAGSQFGIDYNIVVNSQMYNYFEITVYVDGNQYLTQPEGSMTQSTIYMTAPSNGAHIVYLHVEQIENPDVWGNSNNMALQVGGTPPATLTLTTSVQGGSGTVVLTPSGGSYARGTYVVASVSNIQSGYHLDHWNLNGMAISYIATCGINMQENGVVVAVLAPNNGGSPTPTPTPYGSTPTPTPTGGKDATNIFKQIQDWFNSVWQAILSFLRGFGINL